MKNAKEVLEIANYIIKNNATIKDVEENFKLKKTQVLKYINELKEYSNNNKDFKELYLAVKNSLKNSKIDSIKHFIFPDLYILEEQEKQEANKMHK